MANLDRKELDRIATLVGEVENPDVYSKDEKYINKPISNIKFGHILNLNWDNILNTFRIIQKFFKETVLNQDVSTDNVANQIVKRNADKSIEVGDIYSSSDIITGIMPDNSGIAFKNPVSGEIEFTKDYASFRKLTNTISRDDMNTVERLDKNNNANFDMGGGSRTVELNEKAKKYRVLGIMAGARSVDTHLILLLPNIEMRANTGDRSGGCSFYIRWDIDNNRILISHLPYRDGGYGQIRGVWGLI